MRRTRHYRRSPLVLTRRAYERLRVDEPGFLPVSCWCERNMVAVTPSDVRDGRTASCGHPTCHAPGEEDRDL